MTDLEREAENRLRLLAERMACNLPGMEPDERLMELYSAFSEIRKEALMEAAKVVRGTAYLSDPRQYDLDVMAEKIRALALPKEKRDE